MGQRLPLNVYKLLFILGGGAIGAGLRYATALFSAKWMGEGFPWSTLLVNVIGSFLVGVLWAFLDRNLVSDRMHAFLLVGVLGAFTTFSSYALDSMKLFHDGQTGLALTNVLANNLGSMVAVLLGYLVAKSLVPPLK